MSGGIRRGPAPRSRSRLGCWVGVAACLLVAGAAHGRELRVCADPDNLPFSNARQEGFENRIVDVLAKDLGATVTYTWWAQRRGFIRNTLNAGLCDLVPGVPSNYELVRTTAPYIRSTFVFVTRADGPQVASLDDPALRTLKIGVQLLGDANETPPGRALSRRGIVGNVHGYRVSGETGDPAGPGRIVEAVADGGIDVALVWGPVAGYFARHEKRPLRVIPVKPAFDGPRLPMVFDISMGVRKFDDRFLQEIDDALARHRPEIEAILDQYGVPRPDRPLAAARTGK